jgi:hypothetical protein
MSKYFFTEHPLRLFINSNTQGLLKKSLQLRTMRGKFIPCLLEKMEGMFFI